MNAQEMGLSRRRPVGGLRLRGATDDGPPPLLPSTRRRLQVGKNCVKDTKEEDERSRTLAHARARSPTYARARTLVLFSKFLNASRFTFNARTHTHTHVRTHASTHARTHTRTPSRTPAIAHERPHMYAHVRTRTDAHMQVHE